MKNALALIFALCLGILCAGELKVLTIGNSFSESVGTYLPAVTKSGGDKLLLQRANIGDCPLVKHWKLAEQSDRDPNISPYRSY